MFLAHVGAAFLKIKGALMATTATKIATVVVAATVVVGGTVGIAQTEVFASPEERVEKALGALLATEESAFSKELGWNTFLEAISKKGLEADVNFKLEDLPMEELGLSGVTIPNIGVDVTCRYDAKSSQMEMEAGAQVANTTLLSANVYVDEEKAAASVPELFVGFIGANYADSEFLENLKNSELATMLGEEFKTELKTLTESLQDTTQTEKFAAMQEEYRTATEEAVKNLLKSMEAEKADPEEVTVGDKTVECKVYQATFGAEDVAIFVNAVIDETVAFYDTYMEENAASMDEATTELLNEWIAKYKAEVEPLQKQVAENEADIQLKFYMKGKKPVQVVLQGIMEEKTVSLTATFALKGNRYDNMTLTLGYHEGEAFVPLLVLTHVTENTEGLLSSEWKLIMEEEDVLDFVCTYQKAEGDFYLGLLLPAEDFAVEVEGVLNVPDKGKELAFEINDISFTEYGEKVSLGYQTEISLKVFEGKITAPEEIKWDVVSMDAGDWSDLAQEVTGKLYRVIMQLMFG